MSQLSHNFLILFLSYIYKDILKQRTTDVQVKDRCMKLLEEYGSLKYVRNVLEELNAEIRTEIDRLGGNPLLTKILEDSQHMKRQKIGIL